MRHLLLAPLLLLCLTGCDIELSAAQKTEEPKSVSTSVNSVVKTPDPLLLEQKWQLVLFNNTPVVPGSDINLSFDKAGNVNGNTGCNLLMGTSRIHKQVIRIGSLSTTRRSCLSDLLSIQEAKYVQSLEAAIKYKVTADTLTFHDDNDETILSFKK